MNPGGDTISASRLANRIARAACQAFAAFQTTFRSITRRAADRFAARDWRGLQTDAADRLDVYTTTIDGLVRTITELLGPRLHSRTVWVSTKAVYSGLIDGRDDWELAETYFNSLTRRIFTTVGVDHEIEFVHTDFTSPPTPARQDVFRSYPTCSSAAELLESILSDYPFPWSPEERRDESRIAGRTLAEGIWPLGGAAQLDRVDMIRCPFYRGEFAYLVGRLVCGGCIMPIALSIHHAPDGCRLDAVLLRADDVSLLFSYARSYFHVDVERPFELVQFLHSILPHKPRGELYISIGYHRHGKTELYRDMLAHFAPRVETFERAPGPRGMVMVVFTMPSYPFVFKIIKDTFDEPKLCTRRSVIDRYRLVFKHDRAGRLIDAQEFQFLEFDRHVFDEALLEELLQVAGQTVCCRGKRVIVRHCYLQRRVLPLNLFLQEAHEPEASRVVLDYGNAIKDLARSNVFPGDLLLKNFGVTRQKRVVYYDYDEVCLLTECRIRELPDDDLLVFASEPGLYAGPHDVFPEEFCYFLGLPPPWHELFVEHHAELFTLDFWRDLQQRLGSGEVFDVSPYGDSLRLGRAVPQLYRNRIASPITTT